MSIPETLANILHRLHNVSQLSDGSWQARCPAHDDREPSLHVSLNHDRILLHCFAGCSVESICSALGITPRDLFLRNGHAPESSEEGLTLEQFARAKRLDVDHLRACFVKETLWQSKPAVAFSYLDVQGVEVAVRYRVALEGSRFRWQNGAKPKELLYGSWWLPLWQEKGKQRVLLVEGESDCLTLWQAKIPAIGVAGADCLSEQNASLLDGFEVVLWREPDSGGAKLLQSASDLFGDRLKVIEPPPDTKDPSDLWLRILHEEQDWHRARERFKGEILHLMESAKDLSQPLTTIRVVCGKKFENRIYSLRELRSMPLPHEQAEESLLLFGQVGIIRRGRTHLLAGKPRVGKTETLFRGGILHWHHERILYLSEEYEGDWQQRLSAYEDDELPEGVDLWLCAGESRHTLLEKMAQGYSVVVIDTLRGVWKLRDELHPSRVIEDLTPLINLQRRLGFTLICLHHERKAEGEVISDRFAGTNALSSQFDMLLSLSPKGEEGLLLEYEGRTSQGGSILLAWKDGELQYIGDSNPVEFRTLAQRIEGILHTAGRPLTTKEVWKELGEPRPSLTHLSNVLRQLFENRRILREPKEERKGATYRWCAPDSNLLPQTNSIVVRGSDASETPEEDPSANRSLWYEEEVSLDDAS